MEVIAVDPSGVQWHVRRRWFPPRRRVAAPVEADWSFDRSDLPLIPLAAADALAQGVVVVALGLAATVGVPALVLAAVFGWSGGTAVIVWLAGIAVVVPAYPLLRVPFRRPWMIEAAPNAAARGRWSVGTRASRRSPRPRPRSRPAQISPVSPPLIFFEEKSVSTTLFSSKNGKGRSRSVRGRRAW